MTEQDERDVQGGTDEKSAPPTGEQLLKLQEQLRQVNQESASRRHEIAKLQDELDKAQKAQLADQQKWQELAQQYQQERDELKPYKAQAESISATLEALLAAQLDPLTDEARGMVADIPGTAQQKLDWLAKNRDKLTRPQAPPMDAGARGDRTDTIELTPEERQMAKLSQVPISDLAAFKKRRQSEQRDWLGGIPAKLRGETDDGR